MTVRIKIRMLSDRLKVYLRKCGYAKKKVENFSDDTRLYHDLGVYGDVAESHMELLAEAFGVDMTGFEFDEYFPQEFPGKTLMSSIALSVIPGLRAYHLHKEKSEHTPVTLKMIDTFVEQGVWRIKNQDIHKT